MKRTFTIIFLLSTLFSFGQISLEHSFSTNASLAYLTGGNKIYTNQNNVITIYNSDYSVFRTISTPTQSGSLNSTVLLVTNKLFNNDDNIEYVVINNLANNISMTYLYSESGQVLYDFGNTFSLGAYKVGNEYKIISFGLESTSPTFISSSKVYSVPGEYPLFIAKNHLDNDFSGSSLAYPNPSQFNAQIDYQLPQGHNSARLVLTNMAGQTVKTWDVNGFNGKVLINTTEFPAGIYTYSIVVNNAISSSGKLVFQ
jgi:hypothetical protein